MPSYRNYYPLWMSIAEEFGVSNAASMGLNVATPVVKRLSSDLTVEGTAIISQPLNFEDYQRPPILQFRPKLFDDRESELPDEPAIHYEWVLRRTEGFLDVGIHFQSREREINRECVQRVVTGAGWPRDLQTPLGTIACKEERFHNAWAGFIYRLSWWDECFDDPDRIAGTAASVMEQLILFTYQPLTL